MQLAAWAWPPFTFCSLRPLWLQSRSKFQLFFLPKLCSSLFNRIWRLFSELYMLFFYKQGLSFWSLSSSCSLFWREFESQMKRAPKFFSQKRGSSYRNFSQTTDCGCCAGHGLALKTRSSSNWCKNSRVHLGDASINENLLSVKRVCVCGFLG